MLNYFKNNNIFVFIYIYLVLLTQIFINTNDFIEFFFLFIFSVFLSYIISLCLYKIINNINIHGKNRYRKLYLFLFDFIIIFTFAIIIDHFKLKIAGKYEFEFDMVQSINQAMSNKYNEVRSPIFSILFAKIPLLLSNDNLRFVTIYYYVIRSIIVSYVISNLLNNSIILNILGILYYTCMPLSIHSELCIMKDTPCALFTLLLYYLLYKYKNEVNKLNISFDILIVVLLFLINFMRPNAIIFIVLFIITLIYIYR